MTHKRRASLLVAFAHPDDEILHGGVLAHLSDRGARVTLVCATNGEAGRPHPSVGPVDDLGSRRVEELRCSCTRLGIEEPVLMRFHDSARKERQRHDDPDAPLGIRRDARDVDESAPSGSAHATGVSTGSRTRSVPARRDTRPGAAMAARRLLRRARDRGTRGDGSLGFNESRCRPSGRCSQNFSAAALGANPSHSLRILAPSTTRSVNFESHTMRPTIPYPSHVMSGPPPMISSIRMLRSPCSG